METQLLIIKSNTSYIRIKADGFHLCTLDKASVFPFSKLEEVKTHVKKIQAQGSFSAEIYLLRLIEEPYHAQD